MNRTPSAAGRATARPAAPPRSRLRLRAALLAASAAIGLALAFAWGRLGADPGAAADASRTSPVAHQPGPVPRLAPPDAGSDRGAPALPPLPAPSSPSAAGASAPARRAPPEVVARVAAEAGLALERARHDFVARCVPRDGGADRGAAKLTFNVTFDASGREIARGISEDRRSRAPALASCLRRLPMGSLRVSPPGANVGVRVSMNLP
jgi:hypothetical protein